MAAEGGDQPAKTPLMELILQNEDEYIISARNFSQVKERPPIT